MYRLVIVFYGGKKSKVSGVNPRVSVDKHKGGLLNLSGHLKQIE